MADPRFQDMFAVPRDLRDPRAAPAPVVVAPARPGLADYMSPAYADVPPGAQEAPLGQDFLLPRSGWLARGLAGTGLVRSRAGGALPVESPRGQPKGNAPVVAAPALAAALSAAQEPVVATNVAQPSTSAPAGRTALAGTARVINDLIGSGVPAWRAYEFAKAVRPPPRVSARDKVIEHLAAESARAFSRGTLTPEQYRREMLGMLRPPTAAENLDLLLQKQED